MLYERSSNEIAAVKELCTDIMGAVVDVRPVERHFSKFWPGYFSLKDERHTGKNSTFTDDNLKALPLEDPTLSSRDIAGKMQWVLDTGLHRNFIQRYGRNYATSLHYSNDETKSKQLKLFIHQLISNISFLWVDSLKKHD